jgi:SEC-C motif
MIEQLVVPEIDPLTLDSIFPTPGRNDPCSCGSDQKYKKCCLAVDEEVRRVVARKMRQAEAVGARMPRFKGERDD